MKLASLKEDGPDGSLIVVNRALTHAASASLHAPTMRAALDDWSAVVGGLKMLAEDLEAGQVAGAFARGVGAKNLVLTHFSSRYCSKHYRAMNEIRKLGERAFKGPVTTAADLMQIVVNIDGTVRVTEPPPSVDRQYVQSFAEREESSEEYATTSTV